MEESGLSNAFEDPFCCDIHEQGLLKTSVSPAENGLLAVFLLQNSVSVGNGDQRREQCHSVQCHLMVFWRTACTSVSSNAHRYTIVSCGEHSGKHTAIGGDTTYRDLFSAFNASLSTLPHLPKVSQLTTAWPCANSAVSAVRSYIGSSGATKNCGQSLK